MKTIIITMTFAFLVGLILGLYFSFTEYLEKIEMKNAYEIQHLTDYRFINQKK
jgi:uncharacterized protein YneF (UPF0154 family)